MPTGRPELRAFNDSLTLSWLLSAEFDLSKFNVFYLKKIVKVTYVRFCTTILAHLENLIIFIKEIGKIVSEISGS